jgi:hypothetical protein
MSKRKPREKTNEQPKNELDELIEMFARKAYLATVLEGDDAARRNALIAELLYELKQRRMRDLQA